jgi:predicted kinase
MRTDPALMRQRLAARAPGGDASDAGLQTLEYQLATREPLTAEEAERTLNAAGTDGVDEVDGGGGTARMAVLALVLSHGHP